VIRRAQTDADLAAWCDVWTAVTPREPVTLDQVKQRITRQPERLYLVAQPAEEIVGLGFAGPSQSPRRTGLAVRVLPEHRRQGIGSKLLDRLLEHASDLGREWVSGTVFEDDADSIAWLQRRSFEEYGRQVELSRSVRDREEEVSPPPGIEVAELSDEHLEGAYAVAVECFPDMPVTPPIPLRHSKSGSRRRFRDP
jgi:mycothiol synthase